MHALRPLARPNALQGVGVGAVCATNSSRKQPQDEVLTTHYTTRKLLADQWEIDYALKVHALGISRYSDSEIARYQEQALEVATPAGATAD